MPTLDPETSLLLVIDIQEKLMPVIENAEGVIANSRRLLEGAAIFGVPVCFTEQNAGGLGSTVSPLKPGEAAVVHKMTFDATRSEAFAELVPFDRDIVAVGCEAHVCVMQTVLGLLKASRRVYVVRDAVGSRVSASREAGIHRMERHGAEVVTTEMVLFEWLGSARHPRFRDAMRLIK